MSIRGKKAIITGVTGQDGSYLAELLLSKGYEVHGLYRRNSSSNIGQVEHLYEAPHLKDRHFFMHNFDLNDAASIITIMQRVQPDEVYNLAAQSHVRASFETPEYTANCDALGTLRFLEAIRMLDFAGRTKFYQASTSELYGQAKEHPQNEHTPFHPRSPYGAAKLYAHSITVNYREAYNIFACTGILFNHESPRRGESFVTRKIVQGALRIAAGLESALYLGNLNAKRDWGYAKEYVEAMWLMLQRSAPDDYVIATGESHSVKEFAEQVFKEVGIELVWGGSGFDEKGIDKKSGRVVVAIDPYYLRPSEVDHLQGDASKAERELGWKAQIKFHDLVKLMVEEERKYLKL